MKTIELFHVGPQKSGTTWITECLKEHPEVSVPHGNVVYYFDINYHRGRRWLSEHFKEAEAGQKLVDPTMTYLRSPLAPVRIKCENPCARIALNMRHPVTRAFSHYWHEKKKRRYNYVFQEGLKNYDLFASWFEPGFYARHIERYLEHFPKEQILAQLYDSLSKDPAGFIHELFMFYGVDPSYSPSVLGRRINEAKPPEHWLRRSTKTAGRKILTRVGFGKAVPYVKHLLENQKITEHYRRGKMANMEYLCDESTTFLEDLMDLYLPEIERLERLLSIDLSGWKTLEALRC